MSHPQNFSSKIKGLVKYLKKWPNLCQWKQILKVLNKQEKIALAVFCFLFLASASFVSVNFYLKHTRFQPAFGGSFIEGVVGQPRWINPIYAAANDVDRDLAELIYAGLVKYDKQGNIVPDIAKRWEIKEDGKVFEFFLKEDLLWQDGRALTEDDIIFTVEVIQNSDYKSPLRANWLGVEVEKFSQDEEHGIRFKLKKPYRPFLETATTKIIPKHIWQDIPAKRFSLSPYNLQPIGSGPYKIKELSQDKLGYIKSLDLEINKQYFAKKLFIPQIRFLFFEDEEGLARAAKQKTVDSFSLTLAKNLPPKNSFNYYNLVVPRYFAVFLNQEKSDILADAKIRQALNYATDKEALINNVFGVSDEQSAAARPEPERVRFGARVVHSPILPWLYGYEEPTKIYQYNLDAAKELLDQTEFKENGEGQTREKISQKNKSDAFKSDLKYRSEGAEVRELQKCLAQDTEVYPEGEVTGFFGPATKRAVTKFQEKYAKDILAPWGYSKGTGQVGKTTREKLNEVCGKSLTETTPLKFSLLTADQPLLIQTAQALKEQWQKVGVEIEIEALNVSQLEKEVIKKRSYQALLFGEVLGAMPDPFPFWHSSQKKDPGLNLALYDNRKVDDWLEEARQSLDLDKVSQHYQKFQDALIENASSIFLYSPDYIYGLSKDIKGMDMEMIVDPSKRFSTVGQWYIKTGRKWK